MAQISRPFQIALAALALVVLAWFAVLHRPGSSESTGSSGSAGSSASAPTASHTPVRATSHTHATSRTTSAPAKHAASAHRRHAATAHVTRTHTVVTHHAKRAHVVHMTVKHAQPAHATSAAPATHGAPPLQAAVASELAHGKVVLLLFWNSRSSSDAAVHGEVQSVAHKLGKQVAVHSAAPGEVGAFGSITRDIQVYQTPTLLIVNPHKQVTTVTGYTDAYALEQTIREARK